MRPRPACLHAAVLALAVTSLGACSQMHTLRMPAQDGWDDDSALSVSASEKSFQHIMVLPPSGTARGVFEAQLANIEAEFLRRGLTVYTPAVTARAIVPDLEKDRDFQTSQQLSDVERALILAKESNAEAILQVGSFEWIPNAVERHFIHDGNAILSVSAETWASYRGWKRRFVADGLEFTGRLIDVTTGEVVVAFRMRDDLYSYLTPPYVEQWVFPGFFGSSPPQLVFSNFSFDDRWATQARRRLGETLFSKIADRIGHIGVAGDGD